MWVGEMNVNVLFHFDLGQEVIIKKTNIPGVVTKRVFLVNDTVEKTDVSEKYYVRLEGTEIQSYVSFVPNELRLPDRLKNEKEINYVLLDSHLLVKNIDMVKQLHKERSNLEEGKD